MARSSKHRLMAVRISTIDGVRWDLTISQFDRPIPFEDRPATREDAMADTSEQQYRALKSRLSNAVA